jgi:hypothetical protein
MKGCLITIVYALLAIFLIRACRSEKGVVKSTIDEIHEYCEYADSVFEINK